MTGDDKQTVTASKKKVSEKMQFKTYQLLMMMIGAFMIFITATIFLLAASNGKIYFYMAIVISILIMALGIKQIMYSKHSGH
jgi:quinol-cytochrome oxidoreductase complex cytochrome b subunit